MRIQLSDHFTYGKLVRFTLPTIMVMLFTSIYGVVDGFFVSNYVGGTPFASLNLVMPFIMIFSAVGFMLGTGGSALVAMTLGMGEKERANELFSLIVYLDIALGIGFSILGCLIAEPVSRVLGATDAMLPYCVEYTRISMIGLTPFMLQISLHSFLITAEKPKVGLSVTIAAGLTNMLSDWLFMGVLGMGLGSAAVATVLGQIVGGIVPFLYFVFPNDSLLRLGRTHLYWDAVKKTASNGVSEYMSSISMSLVGMLYNLQLMRFAGQNGVAAYGIIMYTDFIFVGIFFGYSLGVSSVIAYHFGANNRQELQNVFRKSLILIGFASLAVTVASEILAVSLAGIFASHDQSLWDMTVGAARMYFLSFLLLGFNLFGSAFFTALNDGMVSAKISFLHTMVFESLSVLLLPLVLGLDGIWLAIVVAEVLAFFVTVLCLYLNRRRYGYAT